MKKVISILLIMSVLIVCGIGSAVSEGFTLHSNVEFGMTRDEVIKLESAAGFDVSEESDMWRGGTYIEIKGNIAGVSNARIDYIFDADDKVKEADYYMFSTKSANGDYDTLLSALKNKYGEPNADDIWISALNDSSILMTGRMIGYIANSMLGTSVVSAKGKTWLLEQDDDSFVSIDIFNIINSEGKDLTYITYGHYTKEDVDNIRNMVINGAQEYADQLINDL